MRKHLSLKNLLLILLGTCATILAAEDLLNTYAHQSLCQTEACGVVGSYLRFGEPVLVVSGVFFFALLWSLVFFAGRYRKPWLWGGATLVLMGGLAFDGGLLGFQFMSLEEFCALCVGVAVVLFLVLLLYAGLRRSLLIGLMGIVVWSGAFLANTVLTPPKRTPALDETVAFSWDAGENATAMHFFFSLECPACANLMLTLGMNNPKDISWRFSPLDRDEDDLQRLARMPGNKLFELNPFLSILRWKVEEDVEPVPIPEGMEQAVERAQTWFVNSGYSTIPLLVVTEGPGKRVILTGAETIQKYLEQEGFLLRSRVQGGLPQGAIMMPGIKKPAEGHSRQSSSESDSHDHP